MPRLFLGTLALLATALLSAQASPTEQAPPPARDTPAQTAAVRPTGTIAGHVLAAEDGRPVKRARAFVVAAELTEGRGTLTDDDGAFQLSGLPAGRYTLTVSKAGFVTLSYGQRRPLQAGTPLQLGDGQQIRGVDFRLPRGSAIAGRIFDETGDPAAGATVRAMRYQFTQGTRMLVPAGTAQTDDRGAFRIWGLNPGSYYVSAFQRSDAVAPVGRPEDEGWRGGSEGRRGPRGPVDQTPGNIAQQAYAPTYYPGVGTIGEATAVSVDVGQESTEISFNLLLVRTARVSGTVTSAAGPPAANGLVSLMPDGGTRGARGSFGTDFNGRIESDGRFTIANVPPGRYILRARANQPGTVLYAAQPLSVAEGDIVNVGVLLSPGATISGTVTFEGARPDLRQVRITAPSVDNGVLGPDPSGRVDSDGRFLLDGVPAGAHWIRAAGARGWSLKSVMADGRDIVDIPIEIGSAQKLSNVTVVLTSMQTEINGTVLNDRSMPVTDVTVLAFPTDSALWQPFARQIVTVRPDQNGAFRLRGLPPGSYYLAAADPTEPGEWFDSIFLEQQRASAVRLVLGEGEVRSSDLRVSPR